MPLPYSHWHPFEKPWILWLTQTQSLLVMRLTMIWKLCELFTIDVLTLPCFFRIAQGPHIADHLKTCEWLIPLVRWWKRHLNSDRVREKLGRMIQTGDASEGHSSVEDASATLDLVRWYILNKQKSAVQSAWHNSTESIDFQESVQILMMCCTLAVHQLFT